MPNIGALYNKFFYCIYVSIRYVLYKEKWDEHRRQIIDPGVLLNFCRHAKLLLSLVQDLEKKVRFYSIERANLRETLYRKNGIFKCIVKSTFVFQMC